VGASALVVGLAAGSSGVILPGTEAKNVGIGLDNDNATNPFIQPPGVTAKQHMDNTDVLFGRDNDDCSSASSAATPCSPAPTTTSSSAAREGPGAEQRRARRRHRQGRQHLGARRRQRRLHRQRGQGHHDLRAVRSRNSDGRLLLTG
jgi:hypothetical protein